MQRLAVVGFGDIARRAAPLLERRFALERLARDAGFDLDQPATLRLQPAEALLHCVPPPACGERDTRTTNLLASLDWAPRRLVYLSTSGVYGDCNGALVDEQRPPNPQTARAKRRADAEAQLQRWCVARGTALIILRLPGIYASDRLPLERLRAGIPVLRAEEDVYTNHIHADDLATIVDRAFEADGPAGVYNAADDTQMRMGDWLDRVADHAGLPRPPRVARRQIATLVPPATLEFMGESRRLDNRRLKVVLGVRLRYPTVQQGLRHEHALGTH
jgi:nucleoside-diphosphate-sugar epimerase